MTTTMQAALQNLGRMNQSVAALVQEGAGKQVMVDSLSRQVGQVSIRQERP